MSETPFQLGRYDRDELLTKASDYLILQHYDTLYLSMSDYLDLPWVSITIEYAP